MDMQSISGFPSRPLLFFLANQQAINIFMCSKYTAHLVLWSYMGIPNIITAVQNSEQGLWQN